MIMINLVLSRSHIFTEDTGPRSHDDHTHDQTLPPKLTDHDAHGVLTDMPQVLLSESQQAAR